MTDLPGHKRAEIGAIPVLGLAGKGLGNPLHVGKRLLSDVDRTLLDLHPAGCINIIVNGGVIDRWGCYGMATTDMANMRPL